MKLTVVIPVRNRPEAIRRCLSAIWANDWPRKHYEVIVVDNGSTDSTAAVAAKAGARLVSEPMVNRCHARNRGASEADTPWIVFLDSDCEPSPGWLAALGRRIALLDGESRAGAIAGAVHDAEAATLVEAYIARRRWFDQEKYLNRSARFEPPFALLANLAVRRDVFLDLGGLDPQLVNAAEDADWCLRLTNAGWDLIYEPEAAVTHHHRATTGAMMRQAYHWGRGQAELFAKWRGDWGANTWVEPRHCVWAIKGLLKSPYRLITGQSPLERREPWFDFLANAAMAWGRFSEGCRNKVLVI